MQVTSILSLAAACSSAGVTALYSKDFNYCMSPPYLPCTRFQLSVALAFISWFLLAVSSLVMFWLLGAVWMSTYTSFINYPFFILPCNYSYIQNIIVLLRMSYSFLVQFLKCWVIRLHINLVSPNLRLLKTKDHGTQIMSKKQSASCLIVFRCGPHHEPERKSSWKMGSKGTNKDKQVWTFQILLLLCVSLSVVKTQKEHLICSFGLVCLLC